MLNHFGVPVLLASGCHQHEYWTMLNHFGVPVLFASGCHQHVLRNVNITFSCNTGTPEMFQYSAILGRSSIWDLKYTFSKYYATMIQVLACLMTLGTCVFVLLCFVFNPNISSLIILTKKLYLYRYTDLIEVFMSGDMEIKSG